MTDTMREAFNVKVKCSESEYTYYQAGYDVGKKAAQADARALVGELVEALEYYSANVKYEKFTPTRDFCIGGIQLDNGARARHALTKAQVFMEGKV